MVFCVWEVPFGRVTGRHVKNVPGREHVRQGLEVWMRQGAPRLYYDLEMEIRCRKLVEGEEGAECVGKILNGMMKENVAERDG